MTVTQRYLGNNWRKSALKLGALGALLVTLPGCQSIEATNSNVAQVRFIDASPDFYNPGLDFYINQTAALYNVGYGTHSSYISVTPGTYSFAAAADGSTPTTTLVKTSATLLNGHTYSYVVGDLLANISGTLLQDQTQPAPSGEISVRFIDQNDVIGAVDIYAIPSGATLLTTKPLLQDVTFGTVNGYLGIPSGSYTIAVLPTGTQPIATTVALYSAIPSGFTGTAGTVYTLFITDQQLTTTPGLNIFSVTDYPQ